MKALVSPVGDIQCGPVDNGSKEGAFAIHAIEPPVWLSVQLRDRLPTLFDPTPQEIRAALGSFSSGDRFAHLARDYFARLTYRSLDYYLSRELANHTGGSSRFANDSQRVAFQQALAQHTLEASRIVKEFAGGWYGKTVWQKQALDQNAINRFTQYAFKKMTSELGRRRDIA